MNNIIQKDTIYRNDRLNSLPHSDYRELQLKPGQNVNSIRLNNICEQLVNNDLFVENTVNCDAEYTCGPKSMGGLSSGYDGYKAYDDTERTELKILHRTNMEPKDTVRPVLDFCQTKTFAGCNIVGSFNRGGVHFVVSENGVFYRRQNEGCYSECPMQNDQDITPKCFYCSDDVALIGSDLGVFIVTETFDSSDSSRFQLTRADSGNIANVSAIRYHDKTAMVIAGTEQGKLYSSGTVDGFGRLVFEEMCSFRDMQYQSSDTSNHSFLNPGVITDIRELHDGDGVDGYNSTLVGTESGMYRTKSVKVLEDYRYGSMNVEFGDNTEIRGVFVLGGSIHVVTGTGIHNVDNYGNALGTERISYGQDDSTSGYSVIGDSIAMVWCGKTLFKYRYDSELSRYSVIPILIAPYQITCADRTTCDGRNLVIVCCGSSQYAYLVDGEMRLEDDIPFTICDGEDDVIDVLSHDKDRVLYMLTENALSSVRISECSYGKRTGPDSLEHQMEGDQIGFVRDGTFSVGGQDRNVVFMPIGDVLYTYDGNGSRSVALSSSDGDIVDFFEYTETDDGRNNSRMVAYVTESNAFVANLDSGLQRRILSAESDETNGSIGVFDGQVIIQTDRRTYTIDATDSGFRSSMNCTDLCSVVVDRYSSNVFGIRNDGYVRYMKDTKQWHPFGGDAVTSADWIQKLDGLDGSGDTLFCVISDHLDVMMLSDDGYVTTTVSKKKNPTQVERICDDGFVSITDEGARVYRLYFDTLSAQHLCTIHEERKMDGMLFTDTERAYGYYTETSGSMQCLESGFESEFQNKLSTLEGHSIQDNPIALTKNGYLSLVSSMVVALSSGANVLTSRVSSDVIGFQQQSTKNRNNCVVVTRNRVYYGSGTSNNFLTATNIRFENGVNCYGAYTTYGRLSSNYQIYATQNKLVYTHDISSNKASAYTELFSLDDGENISSFSLFNNYQTSSDYIAFNTGTHAYFRRIEQTESGVISLLTDEFTAGRETDLISAVTIYADMSNTIHSTVGQYDEITLFRNGKEFTASDIGHPGRTITDFRVNPSMQSQYFITMDNSVIYCEDIGSFHVDNGTYGKPLRMIVKRYSEDGPSEVLVTTQKGVVLKKRDENSNVQITKCILDGQDNIDVQNIHQIRRLESDGETHGVCIFDGKARVTLDPMSKADSTRKLRFKTIDCLGNSIGRISTRGDRIYSICTENGHQVVRTVQVRFGKDGPIIGEVQTVELDDRNKVVSIDSIEKFAKLENTQGKTGFFTKNVSTDAISKQVMLPCYSPAENPPFGKKVIQHRICRDDLHGNGCYFLGNDGDVFRFDSPDYPIFNHEGTTRFFLENGILFVHYGERQRYITDFETKKEILFNTSYGRIGSVASLGGTLVYTFDEKDGIYVVSDRDALTLKMEGWKNYGLGEDRVARRMIRDRERNCKFSVETDDTVEMMQLNGDQLSEIAIGGRTQFLEISPVNDYAGDCGQYVSKYGEYKGYMHFDGINWNPILRFPLDSYSGKPFAVSTGGRMSMFLGRDYAMFGGQTDGVACLRVGPKDIHVNGIFDVDGTRYMLYSRDGQYYFSNRGGTVSIPVKVSQDGHDVRSMHSVNSQYGGTYYVMASENQMLTSHNCLAWTSELTLDYAINDITYMNDFESFFSTENGAYSTHEEYTTKNDFYRYGQSELMNLYRGKQEEFSDRYDITLEQHYEQPTYGHQDSDGLVPFVNYRLMDVRFDRFGTGESDWQKSTKTNDGQISVTTIENDIVNRVFFGDQNGGEIQVNLSNFLVTQDCADFRYIMKRWMSGMTELYVYIPTTNTYYINHVCGTPNCMYYGDAITRKNLYRFGQDKSTIDGSISEHSTEIEVLLDNQLFQVDDVMDIQSNGNSLPLKIYMDPEYEPQEGEAPKMFHSFIEPTVFTGSAVRNGDKDNTQHSFRFCCFGTDSQAIKITFMDLASKTGGLTFKLVFNPNGGTGIMRKQLVKIDQKSTVRVRKCAFRWEGGKKSFSGWSFTKNPSDNSPIDVSDNQMFGYSRSYITDKRIYDAIKDGYELNLYAVWEKYESDQTSTTMTLKSNGNTFYIDSVEINPNTELGNNVVIEY